MLKDVDLQSLHAWVDEAVDYVAYRLRKDPAHPLQATVEMVSASMETVHGASDRHDVSTWFEAVHPDDLPRVLEAHLRSDQTDEVFDERVRRPMLRRDEQPLNRVAAAALLGDGDLLLGTLDGLLARVDPQTGLVHTELDASHLGGVRGIQVAPDGALALVQGSHGAQRILDVDAFGWAGSLPRRPTSTRAVWRGPRSLLLTFGSTAEEWTVEAQPTPGLVGGGIGRNRVAWARDGSWFVTGDGDGVIEQRTAAGGLLHRLQPFDRVVKGLSVDPDGVHVVALGIGDDPLQQFRVPGWQRTDWRATPMAGKDVLARSSGEALAVHLGGLQIVTPDGVAEEKLLETPASLAMTPDGRRTVVGGAHGLSLFVRGALRPLVAEPVGVVAIAADGRTAAGTTPEGVVLVDLPAGEVVARIAADGPPTAVALDPAGGLVIVGTVDGGLLVFQRDGTRVGAIGLHGDRVSGLAVSPDGELLLSISWDGTVRRWELAPFRGDALARAPDVSR